MYRLCIRVCNQVGYINDERFAENYVNFKAGNKPRRQIELKLKQKGVDADIISRICDEFLCG